MVSIRDYFRAPPPLADAPPAPTSTEVVKSTTASSGVPLANDPNYPLVGSDPAVAGLFGYGVGGGTGIPVTPWSALNASSVWACVRVLSEDIARLPIKVHRRQGNGGWVVDEQHPLNRAFEAPNSWQNAFDAICFMGTALALRGNAYAYVRRDMQGRVSGLLPISPDRVSIVIATQDYRMVRRGEILYHISHQTLQDDAGIYVTRDEMIHVKGVSLDGYSGISPVQANANAIGLGLALEQHGNSMFRNGATLGGFLKVAGRLSPEAAAKISDSLSQRHSGTHNAGRIMVLENGSDFSPIVMTSQESQYLETRKFSVVDIARLFRVPPHKIGELSESHYNNLESQNQSFIDDCLLPIARRMEAEFERTLLFENERGQVRIRFDFDEMLRSDTATRFASYAVGLTNGILNRNEVRAKEGLAPVPGGDKFLTPLNLGDPAATKPVETMPAEKSA